RDEKDDEWLSQCDLRRRQTSSRRIAPMSRNRQGLLRVPCDRSVEAISNSRCRRKPERGAFDFPVVKAIAFEPLEDMIGCGEWQSGRCGREDWQEKSAHRGAGYGLKRRGVSPRQSLGTSGRSTNCQPQRPPPKCVMHGRS